MNNEIKRIYFLHFKKFVKVMSQQDYIEILNLEMLL